MGGGAAGLQGNIKRKSGFEEESGEGEAEVREERRSEGGRARSDVEEEEG